MNKVKQLKLLEEEAKEQVRKEQRRRECTIVKDLAIENMSLDAEKNQLNAAMHDLMYDVSVLNRNKNVLEHKIEGKAILSHAPMHLLLV